MSSAKYRLSGQSILDVEHGIVLYRIEAIKTFECLERVIKKGTIGGYVSGYHNLSQEGACWIDDNVKIFGQAKVLENAYLKGSAMAYDDAEISGYARVIGHSIVRENTIVGGECSVEDNAVIEGNVVLQGKVKVSENACLTGDVYAEDYCMFSGNCYCYGKAVFKGKIDMKGDATAGGHSKFDGIVVIKDRAMIKEHASISGKCCISGSAKIIGYSKVDYDVGSVNIINTTIGDQETIQPFMKQSFIEILKYRKGEDDQAKKKD